jgi:hypothetical protein
MRNGKMATINCSERVTEPGMYGSFHPHNCTRKAIVTRTTKEGWGSEKMVTRAYCKQHDPVARAEKMAAKDAVVRAAKDDVAVRHAAQRAIWILKIQRDAHVDAGALVDEIYKAGVRKGYGR